MSQSLISQSIVLGTAGHIDHGKTTLVAALTGIATDRLAEEKRRGISIELGFAHLTLPGQRRVAIIDVPGHERFVKNMLSGVTGIDIVLLIVAADEGVKPQTREHFDICRLLGIERGIVVLTKTDLADPDLLSLVELEVAELTHGTFLENAPICPVSARTGQGMPELIAAIDNLARSIPPRPTRPYPRLPIDRVFTLKGHGTVVTGTLRDASLAENAELNVYPGAQPTRVRSLQVHGGPAKSAQPGQRVAVNLANLDVASLSRGEVLAPPGAFRPVHIIDVSLELLPTAKPLKDRAPVHFHSGTMESEAEVRLLSHQRQIAPNSSAFARLVLKNETLLLPGDRFILRSFSPVHTIAGGQVLDLHFGTKRLKRAAQAERLREWATLTPAQRSQRLVAEHPLGLAESELLPRLAITPQDLDPSLLRAANWLITPEHLAALEEKLHQRLAQHHKAKPLEAGLSREAARSELLAVAPAALLDLLLSRSKNIVAEGDHLRLKTHQVKMAGAEDAAAQRIEAAFREAGLLVPSVDEVLKGTSLPPPQAKSVLALLLRTGQLVRVSPDLIYHRDALHSLKQLIQSKKGQRFGVPEFKDWTGASRKFAIPLLEYLDREKCTRRDGDQRIAL